MKELIIFEQPERANVETPTKPFWGTRDLHVIEPLSDGLQFLAILTLSLATYPPRAPTVSSTLIPQQLPDMAGLRFLGSFPVPPSCPAACLLCFPGEGHGSPPVSYLSVPISSTCSPQSSSRFPLLFSAHRRSDYLTPHLFPSYSKTCHRDLNTPPPLSPP